MKRNKIHKIINNIIGITQKFAYTVQRSNTFAALKSFIWKVRKVNTTTAVWCLVATLSLTTLFAVSENYIGAQQKLKTAQSSLEEKENKLLLYQGELTAAKQDLESTINSNEGLQRSLDDMSNKLTAANKTINDLKSSEYKLVYMGEFKISYYCDQRYSHICGGTGKTASGKSTEVGVTAAADWSVLPKGSIVYINGVGFREIQDVGGAVNGNHIDVLVQKHQEALNLGVNYQGVWLLIKNS